MASSIRRMSIFIVKYFLSPKKIVASIRTIWHDVNVVTYSNFQKFPQTVIWRAPNKQRNDTPEQN